MQWLLALEMDIDPIAFCRLMNTFRRKSVSLVTLSLTASGSRASMLAVVETPETEVEHLFHFLRRTEGVEQVASYLPSTYPRSVACEGPEADAGSSYVFINAQPESLSPARLSALFPRSNLLFASECRWLLEIPAASRSRIAAAGGPSLEGLEFMHLTCAMTTRSQSVPELVA